MGYGEASMYPCVCKAHGKLGGSGGMLPQKNFDFGPFIRHDLVEPVTVLSPT